MNTWAPPTGPPLRPPYPPYDTAEYEDARYSTSRTWHGVVVRRWRLPNTEFFYAERRHY